MARKEKRGLMEAAHKLPHATRFQAPMRIGVRQ
jgi:hypothetical protein